MSPTKLSCLRILRLTLQAAGSTREVGEEDVEGDVDELVSEIKDELVRVRSSTQCPASNLAFPVPNSQPHLFAVLKHEPCECLQEGYVDLFRGKGHKQFVAAYLRLWDRLVQHAWEQETLLEHLLLEKVCHLLIGLSR